MDTGNVRNGEIPFNSAKETIEMNTLINDLARKLCEASVGDKASYKKLTLGLVTEVLCELGTSILEKLTKDQTKNLLGHTFRNDISFFSQEVGNFWFRAFEAQDSAYDRWDLMWEHFFTFSMVCTAQTCIGILINKWLKEDCRQVTTSQRNFIISGSILYYVTKLHFKFLLEGKRETKPIREKFIRITCDKKFNVLDEVLLMAAKEGDVIIIKKMLDCGAHALSQTPKKSTALHVVFHEIEEDNKIEGVVKILMDKCDAKETLVNAQDEEGKTALHSAALKGKENMCKLLLDYGAKPDTRDKRGRLPLHYAVDENKDNAIDVLINVSDQKSIKMLNRKDSDGNSPFDLAVNKNKIEVMTKLLPILKQPIESYFDKLETSKLICQFAKLGNTDIVRKLLDKKASPLNVNEEGKTALHCAAICENYSRGPETIDLILDKCQDWEREQLISKRDKKGKTALHALAFSGFLYGRLEKFECLVDVKDRDGRSPLYDATQGKFDEPYTIFLPRGFDGKKKHLP
ncbi:hypothetical protein SUGI_0704280 [Cryptomeria japonica]|nr:hypothetical protein SUGI_0704280 [Cryptomeria japonica]